MKDVVAGQFLGTGYHLLSTDDTHIVRGLQVLSSCIRVAAQNKDLLNALNTKMHVVHVLKMFWKIAYSVFMLRMARRDIMASVTAFLNCLGWKKKYLGVNLKMYTHKIPI